ncbi:unnamed protein product [Clavelina lepadiformis]|uniref:Uncharacterized protein n=1 Tax=Clavelina lepadiformis TaxID=159417 RepID=A0ABP0FEK3_CLALP
MSHLQPIQHSLDPANEHFHLNDGDEESPGLQPPLEATMTDEQSTPVKTLCRLTKYPRLTPIHYVECQLQNVFD